MTSNQKVPKKVVFQIGGKPAWLDLANLPTPDQLEVTSTDWIMDIYRGTNRKIKMENDI